MSISKERALQMIGNYLTRNLNVADLKDGWPPGSYHSDSSGPVWSICLRQEIQHSIGVGGARYIVISKLTGEIVADQPFGE